MSAKPTKQSVSARRRTATCDDHSGTRRKSRAGQESLLGQWTGKKARVPGWTRNGTGSTLSRFRGPTGGLGAGQPALAGWTQLRSVLPVRPDRPVISASSMSPCEASAALPNPAAALASPAVAAVCSAEASDGRESAGRPGALQAGGGVAVPVLQPSPRLVHLVRVDALTGVQKPVELVLPPHLVRGGALGGRSRAAATRCPHRAASSRPGSARTRREATPG